MVGRRRCPERISREHLFQDKRAGDRAVPNFVLTSLSATGAAGPPGPKGPAGKPGASGKAGARPSINVSSDHNPINFHQTIISEYPIFCAMLAASASHAHAERMPATLS